MADKESSPYCKTPQKTCVSLESVLQALLEDLKEELPSLESDNWAGLAPKVDAITNLDRYTTGEVLPHTLSALYSPSTYLLPALLPHLYTLTWFHTVDRLVKSFYRKKIIIPKTIPANVDWIKTKEDNTIIRTILDQQQIAFWVTGTGLYRDDKIREYMLNLARQAIIWSLNVDYRIRENFPVVHRTLRVISEEQLKYSYAIGKAVLESIRKKTAKKIGKEFVVLDYDDLKKLVVKTALEVGADEKDALTWAEQSGLIIKKDDEAHVHTETLLATILGSYAAVKSGMPILPSNVAPIITHTVTLGPVNEIEAAALHATLSYLRPAIGVLDDDKIRPIASMLYKHFLLGMIKTLSHVNPPIKPEPKIVLPMDDGSKHSTQSHTTFMGRGVPSIYVQKHGTLHHFHPVGGTPNAPFMTTTPGNEVERAEHMIQRALEMIRKAREHPDMDYPTYLGYALGIATNLMHNLAYHFTKYAKETYEHRVRYGTYPGLKAIQVPYVEEENPEGELIEKFIEIVTKRLVKVVERMYPVYNKLMKTWKFFSEVDITSYLWTFIYELPHHLLVRIGVRMATSVVITACRIAWLMTITVRKEAEAAARWVYNRIASMVATFSLYMTTVLSEFYPSGVVSTITVPNKLALLYAFCSFWPKCGEHGKKARRGKLCDPKDPNPPDNIQFDCVYEGVYRYLSALYKTKAEIIKELIQKFKEQGYFPPLYDFLLYDHLYKAFEIIDVSPSAYPLSALVWWSNVVMGTWVWAIQLYGALAALSLVNCMRNAWKIAKGYRDEEFGLCKPTIPHILDTRSTARRWSSHVGRAVELAHQEFGHKVTGIKLSETPKGNEVEKLLKVVAITSRITFTENDYDEVAKLWLKPPRKRLPTKKTLRAFHPASSKGTYRVSKDTIADVVTALLLAAYVLAYLVKKKAHPGVHGLKANRRKVTYPLKTALIGWVYGHYGFMALGQGKLHGKFRPKYAKLTRELIDAVQYSLKKAEELANTGKTKVNTEKWSSRVNSIIKLAWFTVHSYLSWRVYGVAKLVDGKKYIANKEQYHDKLFLTGLCGNTLARGLTPECVDRHATAVILILVMTMHSLLFRLSGKVGLPKTKISVKKKKKNVAGVTMVIEKIKARSPHLPLFPVDGLKVKNTYSDKDDIVSVPEYYFIRKSLKALVDGIAAWGKTDGGEGGIPPYKEPPVTLGEADQTDQGKRILLYVPHPSLVISKYRERPPFSLVAVWGEIHRFLTENTFTCDKEESGPDYSSFGPPLPPETKEVKANPRVIPLEAAPNQPEVPVKPPEPPKPPNIKDKVPKPPKPPQFKCPLQPPQPPNPPKIPTPQLPQPNIPQAPKWNPPDTPWKNLNPPHFDPPQLGNEVSPVKVEDFLHDYFCSIIKYSGELMSYWAQFLTAVLEGAPSYLIKLYYELLDYVKQYIEYIVEEAAPAAIDYICQTIEQFKEYLEEILSNWDDVCIAIIEYVKEVLTEYIPQYIKYIIGCAIYFMMHAPSMIFDYIKKLISWAESLLDPAIWESIMREIINYLWKFVDYIKDLIKWAVKFATAITLGFLYFLKDLYDSLTNKLKQTLKKALHRRILSWKWILTTWATSFIEQYCGPDVLKAFRAGYYALSNAMATLPEEVRNGVAVLEREAMSREARNYLIQTLVDILHDLKDSKDVTKYAYKQFRDLTEQIINDILIDTEPAHLLWIGENQFDKMKRVAEHLPEPIKNRLNRKIDDARDHFEKFIFLKYWFLEYPQARPGAPLGRVPAFRGGVLDNIAPIYVTEGGSGDKVEGRVGGIAEVVHEEEVERFDVYEGFSEVGPLKLLESSLKHYPIRRWLYPNWYRVTRSMPMEIIRVDINPIWGFTTRWWAVYKLSEWSPNMTVQHDYFPSLQKHIQWLMLCDHTLLSDVLNNLDKLASEGPDSIFTTNRQLMWEFAETAYETLSEMYETMAKIYSNNKDLLNSLKEVTSTIGEAYHRIKARAKLLQGIKEFLVYHGGSRDMIETYNQLCKRHNMQVNKFNEMVKSWNEFIKKLEKHLTDSWSIFDAFLK